MEAIGTLAGGIAHDFNNILSAILGYSALTLDEVPPDSEPAHHLQQVLTAGERARVLVQQLLTFSHQTEQAPQPLQFPLSSRKRSPCYGPRSRPRSSAAGPGEQAGAVLADPTQLHQVLLNLCTNAAHAMRETGGVLKVGLDTWRAWPPCRLVPRV